MGYVVELDEIDRQQVALAGGKGASLGALRRIPGVPVPDGVCVTTTAFERLLAQVPSMDEWHARLSLLQPGDRDAIRALSADLRRTIEAAAIPEEVAAEIRRSLARLGEHAAYAVRSSATAEDLPTASSAGQQDTYLDVVGTPAVLEHVRRCWASLFTERAVTYRLHHGLDRRKVSMAVVLQRMVVPQAAGILFTADPVTSDRKVASVEAVPGLGEALASGLVDPHGYRVRDGQVVGRTIPATQDGPALTDAQVLELVELGRRIEAHLGRPQDIEWCLADEGFWVVQSRPITTLFPIPAADDDADHVYLSVGHQQMMTDPMKPLGLALWQLTTPRPMAEAGGRLFVDVAAILASPAARGGFIEEFRRSDPLIGDALQTIVDRGFIPAAADEGHGGPGAPAGGAPAPIEADPALVAELIEHDRASVAALRRDIRGTSGAALVELILADLGELKRILFDRAACR
jgi:pyruvate,water dikinase